MQIKKTCTKERKNINDPQKKYHLGTVSKDILLEGFKPVSQSLHCSLNNWFYPVAVRIPVFFRFDDLRPSQQLWPCSPNHTFSLASLTKRQISASCVTNKNPSLTNESTCRTIEIISLSISTKVWHWAGIELATPRSAVGLATDCATGPGKMPVFGVYCSRLHARWSTQARLAICFPL